MPFAPIGLYMAYSAWIFRDKIHIGNDGFLVITPQYNRFIEWTDINEVLISQFGCNILHKIKLEDD